MALKLSQFTKSVVKTGEPYNLTVLFNKPTAMELLTIQSQTAQLYASYKGNSEDSAPTTEATMELMRYQVDTCIQYCVSIEGLEGEDGLPVVVDKPADIRELISRFPIELQAQLFASFLESLAVGPVEKKS